MKVLFINTVFGKGSTGKIITQIGSAVEAAGGSYMAAYGRGKKADDPHAWFMGSTFDRYLHAALSRITDRTGFYSRSATRKLVSFIRMYQPDVIHLHNLHGYYINLAILFDYLKTEFKGKVVWTLHDCWAFTGHCVHYTWAGCQKWKTGCHHCQEKGSYPASRLLDRSAENYADKKRLFTGVPNMTVVTVSQWLKAQAEQSFLGCYPVECVYNGIDYSRFRPLESDIRQKLGLENKKMILSVSDGWNDRKGYFRLLELAAAAPPDWHFVVVGLSKKQIAAMPANITGMERTWNQEELIKLYTAADVFYNPSVEETFGLVTAEALACGTPAVVMDSTACPEPVCDYGIVLRQFRTDAAIAAIKEITTWKKEPCKQVFTEKSMADNYLACYRKGV